MKLLILTQKVDRSDPILGFFHRWIEVFANHCDGVTVICLSKGESALPETIKVLPLGKPAEGWSSSVGKKWRQKVSALLNFYRFIWRERKNYDTVFVHMNQEYVLWGSLVWKLLGKKILMWRNHPKGSSATRLAAWLSNRVFCTSEYSFTAKFSKTEIMPVGIDTDIFKRDPLIDRKPNSVLFLSRMSPIKKPEVLIEALHLLDEQGIDFIAAFVGDPLPKDKNYYQLLCDLAKKYRLEEKIKFCKGVINQETPAFYNTYEIFVNLTPTGSMDKTIFEAMACGSLVLVSNRSFLSLLPPEFIFRGGKASDLAQKLIYLLNLPLVEKEKNGQDLRRLVAERFDLSRLVRELLAGSSRLTQDHR